MPTTNPINARRPPDNPPQNAPAAAGASSQPFDSLLRARPPKKPIVDEDGNRRPDRPRPPQEERAFAAGTEHDGVMRGKEPVVGDALPAEQPLVDDPAGDHVDVAAQSLAAAASQTVVASPDDHSQLELAADVAVADESISIDPSTIRHKESPLPEVAAATGPSKIAPPLEESLDPQATIVAPAAGENEPPSLAAGHTVTKSPSPVIAIENGGAEKPAGLKAIEPETTPEPTAAATPLEATVTEDGKLAEQSAGDGNPSDQHHEPAAETVREGFTAESADASAPAETAHAALDATIATSTAAEPLQTTPSPPNTALHAIGPPPDSSRPLPTSPSQAETSAGPSPRPTEVDAARFLHRVARAFHAARERGGEVRLRLSPPELGSLSVEIKVLDGVLTARVETETQDARTAVVENLPALRERLAEQGIRVERFDVDLMQQGPESREQSANSERSDFADSEFRARPGTRNPKPETTPVQSPPRVSSTNRLNVLV